MQQLQIPPLAEGEVYAGAIGDQNGDVYHLIMLPGDNNDASWKKQMAWAKKIGGDLPNKLEMAMLFANCRDEFKRDLYWSNQNYVNSEGKEETAYAWFQYFTYGSQLSTRKSFSLRARAVRRLIID